MRWHDRFVNDELWLRSRRVLLFHLQRLGLDSSLEEYHRFIGEQHAAGTRLLARLDRWIGVERAAEVAHEAFLGAAHQRFWLRLPFILAFMAEYARWLGRLAPPRGGAPRVVPELAALFNLGIVLVDQIADAPEQRGYVTQVFGGGRLECLLREAGAARDLSEQASTFATPELRVLASIVAGFFRGVGVLVDRGGEPETRARFVDAIVHAAQAQAAVVAGVRDEAALRAKSVTPFVVPPALTLLAAGSRRHPRLLELGELIGEVFWRVDDLVDVARDYSAGDGNFVLLRTGIGAQRTDLALAAVLDGHAIESVAAEASVHLRAALDLVGGEEDGRRRAATWLEMYVTDWLR